MAHIFGRTFVSSNRVFAADETGPGNIDTSIPVLASTAAIPVGHLTDPDFRVYVGTSDGKIAVFHEPVSDPPQMFQITSQPVLWSLYHAAGQLYLGTGDFSTPDSGTLLALDDKTLAVRWQIALGGPVMYPVGVAYQGNVPKQVIVTNGNPNAAVSGLDVATGAELWSAPDSAIDGPRVHNGVVYYGNSFDASVTARSASDGQLLWSFKTPRNANFHLPMAAGGVVWATSEAFEIVALNASNGSALWEVRGVLFPGPPAVHFDHNFGLALLVYSEGFGIGPGFLRGLDANTGAQLWTSSAPVSQPGMQSSIPIIIQPNQFFGDFQVQVGSSDGSLMSFNVFDGQMFWQAQLNPGEPIFGRPHWAYF
jgi:outer membrane protein assembly factor BamB